MTADPERELFEQHGLVLRSDRSELREQLVDTTTGEIVDTQDIAVLADEAAKALDHDDAVEAGLVPPKGATVGWWRRRLTGRAS